VGSMLDGVQGAAARRAAPEFSSAWVWWLL